MSKDFYTNVTLAGSKIFYRGVEGGRKVRKKLDYNPTLFVPSNTPTKHQTVRGEYVKEIKPGNLKETREFVQNYDGVQGFKLYGNQKYEYVYISDNFKKDVDWDRNIITVCNIDIEVGSENGFPEPATASEPITAITMKTQNKFKVFACGKFNNTRDDVDYIECENEIDLIKRFIDEWSGDYPDLITGWNVKFFDIPYLVNRITNVLGQDWARRLSPWGNYYQRSTILMGREQQTYVISGIGVFDYIELYRKFAPGGMSQESYKLDHICHEEIKERKLSYEEYGNLHRLYKEDFQKFIEYNIRDVELVEKLDDKLKLIDLGLTLAYDSKSNYDDVFQQVRMWDNIIFNVLRKEKMVVPPQRKHHKSSYVGAYVKDPVPNMYRWIASFDLNSLYPHLIMQFNISPDTLIEPAQYTEDMTKFLENKINIVTLLEKKVDTSPLKKLGVTVTPNGQLFTLSKRGFLPKIMEEMYNGRSVYKKKALEAKKELEAETDDTNRFEIEKRIARFNNLQLAKKVCLNSAYGALGSEYFRYFDVRQASAVTTSGQLAIQWIEKKLQEYLNKVLGTTDKDYVIAADTDSVYLNLDELVRQTFDKSSKPLDPKQVIVFLDRACESKIQPFIDTSYEELARYTNALTQKMQMKREALADRGLWTAKKRYILNVYNSEGVEYAKPKIKVTGLEMIKSSTPSACRGKLWEALDVIMNGTEQNMMEFIENFREDFKTLPIPEIAFPRGVNGITEYSDKVTLFTKGTPIHVRGSIIYNHHLGILGLDKKYPLIHEGEKIKFIYLKEPNTAMSNIIAFPQVLPEEFGLSKYIDYNLQFDKSFLEPLKVLLDLIGWKTEETNSLARFFG